ncbi:MAG: HAMP domain-containing histidine kinase [Clostridia bacterium]|nr:HAMP domain-containing histidine kinase [Clostridia bacterium]
MIRRLKNKITLAIAVVLSILFFAQLLVVDMIAVNNSVNSACATAGRIAKRFDMFDAIFESDDNMPPDVISPDGYYAVVYSRSGFKTAYTDGEIGVDAMEAAEYADEVRQEKRREGMIGGLFYSFEKTLTGEVVVLVESAETVKAIKNILLVSVLLFLAAAAVSFVIARLIASRIAKPAEDTFNKQKQFISDAGHELKTPLTVIAANAEMLENEIGENKWLSYIRSETDRMKELVLNLLTLAKLDNADENAAVMTDFDLSAAVEGMAMTFESVAFEQGILIDADVQPGVTIHGTESEIKQLAAILIDNAVKHSVDNGTVRVKLFKDGQKKTVLRVSNTGEPIPPEQREKIFERFYRADEARTGTAENRFGLGLAIAKAITEKHRGKISVDCKDGETTFEVVL